MEKEHGSLYNALIDCCPISLTHDEWSEALEASMKKQNQWLGDLIYEQELEHDDVADAIERLVLKLAVERDQRKHYQGLLRSIAPCPECRGLGHSGMQPDFIGDDPKTMTIGTVSICQLCHGAGVDPNYRPDKEASCETRRN
jgi:hypothetical protein